MSKQFFFFAMSALIIFGTVIIISLSGSSVTYGALKIEAAFSLWRQIAANPDAFKMQSLLPSLSSNEKWNQMREVSVAPLGYKSHKAF